MSKYVRNFGKVALAIAALFSIATATTGCKASDVVGTIAVVAGAIVIDDAIHGSGRCHGGYVQSCSTIYDRWGRPYPNCRQVWDSCARRYSTGFELSAGTPLAASVAENDTAVAQVAAKYNIPLESAERLTKILREAAGGKADAYMALGLSEDDLKRVARYKMPSDAALDQVGVALALSREMARGLVQQLMDETRAQMANVDSPAWKSCQSTGKWKTDANGGTCKSLTWQGCSPATGATVCSSVR